jgi:hypothetical protein
MPYNFTITEVTNNITATVYESTVSVTVENIGFDIYQTQQQFNLTESVFTTTIYTNAIEIRLDDFTNAFKGDWVTGTTYIRGDLVNYQYSLYVSNIATGTVYVSNSNPVADYTKWNRVVWHEAPFTNLTATNVTVSTGISNSGTLYVGGTSTFIGTSTFLGNISIGGGGTGGGLTIANTSTFDGPVTFNGQVTVNSLTNVYANLNVVHLPDIVYPTATNFVSTSTLPVSLLRESGNTQTVLLVWPTPVGGSYVSAPGWQRGGPYLTTGTVDCYYLNYQLPRALDYPTRIATTDTRSTFVFRGPARVKTNLAALILTTSTNPAIVFNSNFKIYQGDTSGTLLNTHEIGGTVYWQNPQTQSIWDQNTTEYTDCSGTGTYTVVWEATKIGGGIDAPSNDPGTNYLGYLFNYVWLESLPPFQRASGDLTTYNMTVTNNLVVSGINVNNALSFSDNTNQTTAWRPDALPEIIIDFGSIV